MLYLKMRILLCLFLIVFTPWLASAQQSAYFIFGEKEFEGVDIYDLIQDNENNYWFATDQGLIKHDGYSFENIECDEMKGGAVFGFVKSANGVIYCHNLNHQIFAIDSGKCSLFFEIPDKGLDISLLTTPDNQLFINSSFEVYLAANRQQKPRQLGINKNYISPPILLQNNHPIFHYMSTNVVLEWDNGKFVERRLTFNQQNLSWLDERFKFLKFKNQTYLFSTTNNVLYLLNEKTFELTYQTSLASPNSHNTRIYPIDNTLFVCNNISGVYIYSGEIKLMREPVEAYSNYFISDVYKDNEGNVLLSTFDHGVLVIPDIETKDVDPQFSQMSITKLFSTDEAIYLGTHDGQLVKFGNERKEITQKNNKKIETLFKSETLPYLLSDIDGFTITNTESGISENLPIGALKDVVEISPNQLALALNTGIYFLQFTDSIEPFAIEKTAISERAYSLCYEKSNQLIYSSTSSGLFTISASKKIQEITFKNKTINAITLCSYGDKTYITTRKEGVLICQNGKVISQFYPRLNKTDLAIFKVIIHNNTWYANTQLGLVLMDEKGKVVKMLNSSSGLSTHKIIDFAVFKNELWVTNSRGVQRFNLTKINQKIDAPQLFISSVLVNDKKVSKIQEKGDFSANSRRFKFVFKVNTLKNRENIRYHFKLEGNNEKWHINPYQNNEVVYNALGPGNYRFLVKAENNGLFSEIQTYSFSISAPFYQKTWFTVLIGMIILGMITFLYYRQLRIQRKKADQRNELNASRLTAIQSQMNPHFIFNSLNSIQDLVLKGDIDNSYTYITTFSNLVRRTLNYSEKDFIEFDQEIKLIELYLSLEKLRFKDDIDFSIQTIQAEDIMIPPMLIQPFIENALVHGLLHKEGEKKLTIQFKLTDVLICEIIDNGVGRKKAMEIKNRHRANQESFAVNAIKRRFNILKDHFNGELGFEMEDLGTEEHVEGTKVTLRIPIKKKY